MAMKIYFMLLLGILLYSCNDSSELYDYPVNKIGFLLEEGENKIISKTFVYDHSEIVRDTVYLKMRTMGFVTKEDRPVVLEQMEFELQTASDTSNAVAGVHYVPFDDAEYEGFAVVKGGSAEASIPVILLRHASLADGPVVLKVRIVENDIFQSINPELSVKTIVFSDILQRPLLWGTGSYITRMFGAWGPVKHHFFIDHSDEFWDDTFLLELQNDYPYLQYWRSRMRQLVAEENARRATEGEDPLQEDDGTLIVIP